jgi:hypothetical protein
MDLNRDLPPQLVFIMLANDGGAGHAGSYTEAVQKATADLHWPCVALRPENLLFPQACSPSERTIRVWGASPASSGWLTKLKDICVLVKSLSARLREARTARDGGQVIVVVDGFTFLKLACVMVASLRFRDTVHVWPIYRYDSFANPAEGRAYRGLHWVLFHLWPRGHFRLLTDSDPLQEFLKEQYGLPVHTLPVPHTFEYLTPQTGKPSGEDLTCWWPGLPHPAKGLEIMRRLAQATGADSGKFRIAAARESGLREVPGGPKIELIDSGISQECYARRMLASDIILLPYDPASYRRRTSGIFVEAVTAGRMPLIRKGGWMSHELKQFNLAELEFDWESPGVFTRMLQLSGDGQVRQKLERMRAHYCSFHSIPGYARALQRIWNTAILST